MAARRQSSATSLSKYARTSSPDLSNRSLDFCNAFWGPRDEGVEVLLARMRGAARTVDEIKSFWKERASIEEDYAKRLSKLAKQTLGKDEIGELRNSLDTLRLEADKQANAHSLLAQQIRSELENPATSFSTRQTSFKRIYQASIEKAFKAKQTQESYVAKAREKYESDCMRINSYTAQSTLVQGKDLEKITAKLDRARQTVTANERDFANFARALQETTLKWERDWKSFCDGCHDLEEERIEFIKDNMWAFANAVSTVCVSDDESCEKLRIALEQLEPERDMENFVRDYGTGNEVSEPPRFFSHTNPESSSAASSSRQTRYAHFQRATQRPSLPSRPPPEEEPLDAGNAGIGAGERPGSASYSRPSSAHGMANEHQAPPAPAPSSASYRSTAPERTRTPAQETQAPTHKTMLQVGENAYEVEPDKDPQSVRPGYGAGPASSTSPAPGSSDAKAVGTDSDPLAKQMADLRMSAAGTARRNSTNVAKPSTPAPGPVSGLPGPPPPPSSSLHSPSSSQQINYRNSADLVVGGYPPSASRPHSPANPPAPVFMQPSSPKPTTPSSLPVEEVLASYQQSFPGERKVISRSNSPAVAMANSNRNSTIDRPRSREGHAGIGAHGRTPSPQPSSMNSHHQPSNMNRSSMGGSGPAPPASSTSVGISLDATGRVAHDELAERYQQQQQQQSSHYAPQRSQSAQVTSPVGLPPQASYAPPPPTSYAQQPPQAPYNQAPPPGSQLARANTYFYNPHANAQPQQPPPPQQPPYVPPPQQPVYQPPPPQSQPQPAYAPNGSGVHRVTSMSVPGYQPPGVNGMVQQNGAVDYRSNGFHAPPAAPVHRTPSPAAAAAGASPTGAYTDDGKPILFYVKAMYDYQATIEEEFDFQSGDVIAVTSTPEDGWWTGVLLDDSRRIPGRTVFPSNFVCLF